MSIGSRTFGDWRQIFDMIRACAHTSCSPQGNVAATLAHVTGSLAFLLAADHAIHVTG